MLLAAPLAIRPCRRVLRGETGPDLVRGLAETGQLQLAFGVLFTVGLALGSAS